MVQSTAKMLRKIEKDYQICEKGYRSLLYNIFDAIRDKYSSVSQVLSTFKIQINHTPLVP